MDHPRYTISNLSTHGVKCYMQLGRHGLSEIINHLIASDAADHTSVVFDFLVDGKLLRVPLQAFIERHRLSTEHIIAITYFPAVRLSDEAESVETPSWVGSIDNCDHGDTNIVAAGCFNGQVKLFNYDSALSEVASLQAHDEPIRSVLTWIDDSSRQHHLLTSSKDRTIKLWRSTTERLQFRIVATMKGHLTSVESLTQWTQGGVPFGGLLSGDWSGNVFAWNISRLGSSLPTHLEEGSKVVKKSKKDSHSINTVSYDAGNGSSAKPIFSLRAHSQCVSGIEVLERSGTMVTCSWDHSWKAWDLERQDSILTCVSSKVFTSLHCNTGSDGSEGKPLIASSHPDGKCRLWDLDSNSSRSSFGRSSEWISQVRWCPSSENVFAAADYSGCVTLWDIRSSVPLSQVEVHSGKALCVHWIEMAGGSTALSGGSDCCLKSTPLMDSKSE